MLWALADQYAEFYSDFMDKDPTSKRGDGRSPAAKRLQVEAIWRVIRQLGEGGNLALAELTPKKALEMFTLLRKVRLSKSSQILPCMDRTMPHGTPRAWNNATPLTTYLRCAQELKIRSDKELEFLKASLQKSKNGDQKLGDVSPFLAEFDGDSGDGQQIVIPGQHLTRPNAASEDESDPSLVLFPGSISVLHTESEPLSAVHLIGSLRALERARHPVSSAVSLG